MAELERAIGSTTGVSNRRLRIDLAFLEMGEVSKTEWIVADDLTKMGGREHFFVEYVSTAGGEREE